MIGVQLYSVRDVDLPWPALFERLAAMGYEGIETAGIPGGDAAQARRWADDAGLSIAGVHVETLRRWLRSELLPAVRLPGGYRIRREDLERLLAGGVRRTVTS